MRHGYHLLAGTCAAILATTAHAQTVAGVSGAEAPAQSNEAAESIPGGDIVVTALRRNERLQDVPVSITALGAADLTAKRITTANDLVGSIPNLRSSAITGSNSPIFALRGVSQADYSVNQQGPVATYFDEVYKGSAPLVALATYDLERVEVLRGPQGTLYGKNTTGGAINFISAKPQLGETSGNLTVGVGNYSRYEASGALNVPISSIAAFRGAFTFARADGWFKNLLPGRPDGNAVREYAFRGSLLVEPTDSLTFILRAQTSLQNPINYAVQAEPLANGVGNGIYEATGSGSSYFRQGVGRRETETGFVGRFRRRTAGAGLTTNWKASDALTVTSVTSYDYGKLVIPEDPDGSPVQAIDDVVTGKAKQFAQDLRLSSDFASGPNFILGGYFNTETVRGGSVYRYFTDVDANGDGALNSLDCQVDFFTACIYQNSFKQTRRTVAVYSDANWALDDHFILRGGLRYTRDRGRLADFKAQVLGSDSVPIANTIPGDPIDFNATTNLGFSQSAVTGKVGVDFKIDSAKMIYASFSRGFRGKSFNSQAYFFPGELGIAKEETVNSYEIGFKTQFMDRRLTINGAAFYYDYRNQQALSIDPVTLGQQLVNIPKSRIYGGELEVNFRPVDRLRIFMNAGFLNSSIQKGVLSGINVKGNQLPTAPHANINVGADVDVIDNDSGKLTASADVVYTSKQYFELFNNDALAQSKYAVANARLSYAMADGRYTVAIWGKNIFDRIYRTAGVDATGLGLLVHYIGEPRTYGLSASVKF
jgi:iron complex outermembrane receptor protein